MTGARRLQEAFPQFRLHAAAVAADRRMAQELAEVKRRISEATSSGSSNIAVWPQPVSSRNSAFGSSARNRSACSREKSRSPDGWRMSTGQLTCSNPSIRAIVPSARVFAARCAADVAVGELGQQALRLDRRDPGRVDAVVG